MHDRYIMFLQEHPLPVKSSMQQYRGDYILCLGNIMPAYMRTALRPCNHAAAPTGTIGFLTFSIDEELKIRMVGVEQEKKGYARMMVEWTERAARALNLPMISIENIVNPRLEKIIELQGYVPAPDYWSKWEKKLV